MHMLDSWLRYVGHANGMHNTSMLHGQFVQETKPCCTTRLTSGCFDKGLLLLLDDLSPG